LFQGQNSYRAAAAGTSRFVTASDTSVPAFRRERTTRWGPPAFIRCCSDPADGHDAIASGETNMPPVSQPQRTQNIMGDKSPKATQKKSTQKQSKATSAGQKKQQAVAAKQAGKKK